MSKYAFLEPIQVGHMRLKNRVVLTPMARYIASDDGFITERYCNHFERIAKGGAALIIPGIAVIDSKWPYISNNQPWLDDDKFIPGLARFADVIHNAGAKVAFQLWCAGGARSDCSINDFSLEEIQRLQTMYVNAARRCKAAGADAVEFHMAHTYMPGQFLSPAFNKRRDQYGADSVENAVRFSLECINRIRDELCDEHFDILVKINGDDYVDGGVTPEWSAKACEILEKAGVAMFTVNAGGAMARIVDMSDDGRRPEGWKVYLAEKVKQHVQVPVAACGDIRHHDFADQIIREGRCDMLAIARGLHAEPDWVVKAAEGREDEVRHCISCLFCFTTVPEGVSGCSVNPYAKREGEDPGIVKNGNRRPVSVVGAGPSGLEAAYRLGERGFDVTLYEKQEQIGGLLRLASTPPGKSKMAWLCDYYEKQIPRLGIQLVTGKEVTAEDVIQTNPYAIFVATGSNELVPPIAGIKGDHVVSVRALLRGDIPCPANRNVVVLGGGLTGLEAAAYIAENKNNVTVLEMLPQDPKANIETKLALEKALERGAAVHFSHKVLRVLDNEVIALDIESNKEVAVQADVVVLSLGLSPNTTLAEQLEQKSERVFRIGDCRSSVKISSAVQSGCDAAQALQ